VIIFAIKCFQEPNFCRSEKHIENIKRFELAEQKGDKSPEILDAELSKIITNPQKIQLPSGLKGGKK
jgi:hypothetical protein